MQIARIGIVFVSCLVFCLFGGVVVIISKYRFLIGTPWLMMNEGDMRDIVMWGCPGVSVRVEVEWEICNIAYAFVSYIIMH